MHVYFDSLALALALLLPWLYVVWRSVKILPRAEKLLGWRPGCTFAALLFLTVSTGLAVFMATQTAFTGGYPDYDPVGMFCLRLGFFSALLSLLAAPAGVRKLRLSVSLLALINLLLWFIDGMAQ